MPMVVRQQFQNCGRMILLRMTHVEIYGILAASSKAIQPVDAPTSTQSTHTMRNVGLEHGNGALMVQEPLELCQERHCSDLCNSRSLHQQVFTEAYHITKHKEWMKRGLHFFMSQYN